MKKWILILVLIFSVSSFASGGAGNSGGVIFCPLRTMKARLFDIYEAESYYYMELAFYKDQTYAEISPQIFSKLRNHNLILDWDIRQLTRFVINNMTKKDYLLVRLNDVSIKKMDSGCSYEQLANWDDSTNKIRVDEYYFNLLSPRDQAAFIFHEAIYKYMRIHYKIDHSDDVRLIIAELFSVLPYSPTLNEYLTQGHL